MFIIVFDSKEEIFEKQSRRGVIGEMEQYIRGVAFMAVPALIFCGILANSMRKDRSRYRNTFFVMFAGISVVGFLCALAGPYSGLVFLACFILIFLSILIAPVSLIINGIIMIRKEGKRLPNLLSLFVGIIVEIGEISSFALVFWPGICSGNEVNMSSVRSQVMNQISEGLLFISLSVIYFCMVFASFMFYTIFLQIIPHKRDFDYVIIHGAGIRADGTVTKLLAERCDKAVKIYQKDPTPPYLIPSGGKGSDEICSEADAMARYLMECGIPEEKIIKEDQSTTTLENLQNSKKIIDACPGRHYTALVTSNYHVYRALRYCRKIGLHCTGIGSRVAAYYWPSALIREFVAIHKEKKHALLFAAGWLLFISPVLIDILC